MTTLVTAPQRERDAMSDPQVIIDFATWTIRTPHGDSPMTNRERAVLLALTAKLGQVVTREALYQAMWGWVPPRSAALSSRLSVLRRKGIALENRWGVGWRLRPESVRVVTDEPASSPEASASGSVIPRS